MLKLAPMGVRGRGVYVPCWTRDTRDKPSKHGVFCETTRVQTRTNLCQPVYKVRNGGVMEGDPRAVGLGIE